jgi:hypothetical protein
LVDYTPVLCSSMAYGWEGEKVRLVPIDTSKN